MLCLFGNKLEVLELEVWLSTQVLWILITKGLANVGTWFYWNYKTKQDKKKVIDGLRSVNEGS